MDHFCKLFGVAAQWYECLCGEIHQYVKASIECAYISAAQGAPPQPASPPTTHCIFSQCGSAPKRLGLLGIARIDNHG